MLTFQKKNIIHTAGESSLIKKTSLISIDIVRAIAALGVFAYHQHIFYLAARYLHLPCIETFDNFGATYAVPLFFLISGYCIHLSNIKYIKSSLPLPLSQYYKRRLLRIYPPYLVALVISLIIQSWLNNIHYTLTDIMVHILLLQGYSNAYFNSINLVLWTISIEFSFYLLYPFFYYLRLKYSLNKALVFTGIISSISIIWFTLQPEFTLVQQYFVSNIWFAWCCGAYLADMQSFDRTGLNKNVYKITYVLIVIAFILVRVFYKPWLAIVDYQLKILIWLLPLLLVFRFEKWFAKHNTIVLKLITAVGLSSYSLYLLHEPLIALKNYLVHVILPVSIQPVGIALGVVIIPAVCWLNYRFVERPFMVRKSKVNG